MALTKESYENATKPAPNSKLETRLLNIYGGNYGNWIRSFGLLPSWKMPTDCLERFIWHGYRPNPNTYTFCLKSAFYPTNETLNFWTHFLPFLFLLWRTLWLLRQIDDPMNSKYCLPWLSCFGTLYVMLASSLAHLFNCKSPTMQEFGFCLDMNAIAVFAGANFLMNITHVCPMHTSDYSDLTLHFISTVALLWIAMQFFQVFSRHERCAHPVLLRVVIPSILYGTIMLPCFLRFISPELLYMMSNPAARGAAECDASQLLFAKYFRYHFVLCIISSVIKTKRFPEKQFPGMFDIIGSSHQLFHISTATAAYYQHKLIEVVVLDTHSNLHQSAPLDFSPRTVLYSAMTYFAIILPIIGRASADLGRAIEMRRKLKKQT